MASPRKRGLEQEGLEEEEVGDSDKDEEEQQEEPVAKRQRQGNSDAAVSKPEGKAPKLAPWLRAASEKGQKKEDEDAKEVGPDGAESEGEPCAEEEEIGSDAGDDGISEEYDAPADEPVEGGKGAKGRGRSQGLIELASLGKRVKWLNGTGGLQGAIYYNDVAREAEGLPAKKVFDILKSLEENQDKITDATRWVCSALARVRKAQDEGMDPEIAGKIQRRVRWLNGKGGFDNRIQISRVEDVAVGVPFPRVMDVLANLEEKGINVEDPTAWVCSSLRKIGKEEGGAGGGPSERRPPAGGGGARREQRQQREQPDATNDDGFDRELRRRIHWLNNDGGFRNDIFYLKVRDACDGLDEEFVWEVLDNLLDTGAEDIRDPTSWVCSGLKKIQAKFGKGGGGKGQGKAPGRPAGGAREREPPASSGRPTFRPTFPSADGGGERRGRPRDVEEDRPSGGDDRQLRQRVAWLNGKGGFDNQLSYKKMSALVAEQGNGDLVLQVLNRLEGLPHRNDIEDPTGWVLAGAKKAFAGKYGRNQERDGPRRGGRADEPPAARRRREAPDSRRPPPARRSSQDLPLPPPPPPPPPSP